MGKNRTYYKLLYITSKIGLLRALCWVEATSLALHLFYFWFRIKSEKKRLPSTTPLHSGKNSKTPNYFFTKFSLGANTSYVLRDHET